MAKCRGKMFKRNRKKKNKTQSEKIYTTSKMTYDRPLQNKPDKAAAIKKTVQKTSQADRDLQQKKEKPKKRKKGIVKRVFKGVFHFALTCLFIAMLFFTIYRYSEISKLRYEINAKNEQISNLENDIKVETVKLYDMTTTQIIEQKALQELGMVYRTPENTVYIEVE